LTISLAGAMIAYRKKFIRIVECWNGETPAAQNVDLIRRFQQLRPLSGMVCREFHTILVDLTRAEENIFADMKRGTRYEIRRAMTRDKLVYEYRDGSDPRFFNEFCADADEFLSQKGQPGIDRHWLTLLTNAGHFEISRIADEAGQTLAWHGYHRSSDRSTLLYSASPFRNKHKPEQNGYAGRANRYHHWRDMLRFKATGVATYDFGGWYDGRDNQERLRINRFKEQFGGEIVRNYICEQPMTFKGSLFLRVRRLLLGNAI